MVPHAQPVCHRGGERPYSLLKLRYGGAGRPQHGRTAADSAPGSSPAQSLRPESAIYSRKYVLVPPYCTACDAWHGRRARAPGSQSSGAELFFSTKNTHTCTQRYLQPPFVEPMCVSGHCAPQPRFSSAIIWGAYDMWMFRGSRAWPQWGVVHRFHVLLACRKFWFSRKSRTMGDGLVGNLYMLLPAMHSWAGS